MVGGAGAGGGGGGAGGAGAGAEAAAQEVRARGAEAAAQEVRAREFAPACMLACAQSGLLQSLYGPGASAKDFGSGTRWARYSLCSGT